MLLPESLSETPDARARQRWDADVRYRRHVQDLLQRRTDLDGVSGLADLMSDGTRWAV